MASWRPMNDADLPAVFSLANDTHSGLPESFAVFEERLKLFPSGCLVLEDAGIVCGYIISHPIADGQPPSLDQLLGAIQPSADMYYIHDLVVSSKMRGGGLAGKGVAEVISIAALENHSCTCLISVYGTAGFWQRHGFERQACQGDLAEKLKGYGSDAVFMTRQNAS